MPNAPYPLTMTPTLIIIGLLFILAEIIGCVIPGIPGPPLAYLSLVFIQFADKSTFTLSFLILWGIIIGLFLGAYLGELIGGMKNKSALKAGLGSFIGFATGTLMKLTVSLIIAYYFFTRSWELISISNKTYSLKS